MSKTTLDLSTLSDISDGTHTVKVKAKADGYRDSDISNEVSYTKVVGYQGYISCDDYYMTIYGYDSNDDRIELKSGVTSATVSGYDKYLVNVGNTFASFNDPTLTNCTFEYWKSSSGYLKGSNWRITPSGKFRFYITST
jgi:hypothetical protein